MSEKSPLSVAELAAAIERGEAIVCYARCEPCQFDSHYDPPEWHSWAGAEDIEHAARTGQSDPSGGKCGCECAAVEES